MLTSFHFLISPNTFILQLLTSLCMSKERLEFERCFQICRAVHLVFCTRYPYNVSN